MGGKRNGGFAPGRLGKLTPAFASLDMDIVSSTYVHAGAADETRRYVVDKNRLCAFRDGAGGGVHTLRVRHSGPRTNRPSL